MVAMTRRSISEDGFARMKTSQLTIAAVLRNAEWSRVARIWWIGLAAEHVHRSDGTGTISKQDHASVWAALLILLNVGHESRSLVKLGQKRSISGMTFDSQHRQPDAFRPDQRDCKGQRRLWSLE